MQDTSAISVKGSTKPKELRKKDVAKIRLSSLQHELEKSLVNLHTIDHTIPTALMVKRD
jgi:hypothetical protein